jgi:hypothetical protein
MTTKLMAAVLLMFSATLLFFVGNTSDPLFLFVSADPAVSVLRFLLVCSAIYLSVNNHCSNSRVCLALKLTGIAIIIFSFVGLFDTSFESALFSYIKPLDYLFGLSLGVFFNLLAITSDQLQPIGEVHLPTGRPLFMRVRSLLS